MECNVLNVPNFSVKIYPWVKTVEDHNYKLPYAAVQFFNLTQSKAGHLTVCKNRFWHKKCGTSFFTLIYWNKMDEKGREIILILVQT